MGICDYARWWVHQPVYFAELISESPGILLVEYCKGHTSISHDNSAGFQEETPCPIAVDFSRD
jgi:hypothetical protein